MAHRDQVALAPAARRVSLQRLYQPGHQRLHAVLKRLAALAWAEARF
ncbi:MAG: hypothetical protein ACK4MX_11550 [Thermaurantiacus sp.]